jgi:Asp-tRNA(Asn)/Glu-tRNA(Gln) amidotransferase A subunit family amidase
VTLAVDPFSSLSDLAQALRSNAWSATALTELFLDRFARLDPILQAFFNVLG